MAKGKRNADRIAALEATIVEHLARDPHFYDAPGIPVLPKETGPATDPRYYRVQTDGKILSATHQPQTDKERLLKLQQERETDGRSNVRLTAIHDHPRLSRGFLVRPRSTPDHDARGTD